MSLPRSSPVRFTPKGLSDACDATDVFPGACKELVNLVFDQANPELLAVRPGVGTGVTIGGTFISVHIVLGTLVFGMASNLSFAGFDAPFCYDTIAGVLVPITGVTVSNIPLVTTTTGKWTPPTMAVVGNYLIVTHPGFYGVANVFGYFNLTTVAWGAGNLGSFPLPGIPTAVANYNNRAYFSYREKLFYSDSLSPLTCLAAGQTLTLGDSTAITALSGLPIQTTSSGIIGALVVFKASSIWQVTGDGATLALAFMALGTGCAAPRTVVSTPFGLAFVSVAGPAFISPGGVVTPMNYGLSGNAAPDIQVPFQLSSSPSRMSAGFQGNIYRVCVPEAGGTYADYWFDLGRQRWSGPHTFAYDCASAISTAATGTYFFLSSYLYPGQLFSSVVQPQSLLPALYNDLGSPIAVSVTSSSLPKTGHMQQKFVVESTIELASAAGPLPFAITTMSPRNVVFGTAALTTDPADLTCPDIYQIPWSAPIVFEKMSLTVTATASDALSIGTMYFRYQDTGYLIGY